MVILSLGPTRWACHRGQEHGSHALGLHKAERWKELPEARRRRPLLTLGPDPVSSPPSTPRLQSYAAPLSAPGSVSKSVPWVGSHFPSATPEYRRHDFCSIHWGTVAPPAAPALLSALLWEGGGCGGTGQLSTSFKLFRLKWFAPQKGAGANRYCPPLFTGLANGEDLSAPPLSPWTDLQDSLFSVGFPSLPVEPEAQGQTKALCSWPICTGDVSLSTCFFYTDSSQWIGSFWVRLNCLNGALEKQIPCSVVPDAGQRAR